MIMLEYSLVLSSWTISKRASGEGTLWRPGWGTWRSCWQKRALLQTLHEDLLWCEYVPQCYICTCRGVEPTEITCKHFCDLSYTDPSDLPSCVDKYSMRTDVLCENSCSTLWGEEDLAGDFQEGPHIVQENTSRYLWVINHFYRRIPFHLMLKK